MANKKKLEKELKRLKKKADKAKVQKEDFRKKIKRLSSDLSQREKQIAKLQRKRRSDPEVENAPGNDTDLLDKVQEPGMGASHKETWKKFSYLRNRYEFYLEEGKVKIDARRLANEALVGKYGEAVGYSEEELDAILS